MDLGILDTMPDLDISSTVSTPEQSQPYQLEAGELDPRLKLMSYSGTLTLHKCPRRYQLYRLEALQNPVDDVEQQVTFDYGHVVGQGIQDILEGKSEEEIYLTAFVEMWEGDFLAENTRKKKSFAYAMAAVEKFKSLYQEHEYLAEYELMYFEGKPAVELGFKIIMPDGFIYRGNVDVVLRHKVTGQVIVLELKTTGSNNINSAQYKNSAQAIGYSVVLDFIAPEVSTYTVLYLVYSSTSLKYTELPFDKTHLQRALWLQALLIDKKQIEMYHSFGDFWPMRGESCYDFFKECPYLSLCNMSTDNLIKQLTVAKMQDMQNSLDDYPFTVTFEQLIESQLAAE